MIDGTLRRSTGLALVAAALVLVLAGQAVGDRLATSAGSAGTERALGRAGFAYLTGLRTFAAAVLWNRINPQHDTYYQNVPLQDQTFMLPTMRMVTWLDPKFVEAYFVAPWLLYRNGRKGEADAIMLEGIRNNPDSGRLHSAYAQLLLLDGRIGAAVREAEAARTAVWRNDDEKFYGYAIMRDVYHRARMKTREAEAKSVLAWLKVHGKNLPASKD
jgi:hypothetical protein